MQWALNGLLAVLLAAIALTLAVAVRRRDVAAAVNALVSLAIAMLPLALVAGVDLPVDSAALVPALPLWVAVAALLHSIGMLGPYDSVWWWDHLTHTVSATLVAALVYAGLLVAVTTDPSLSLSPVVIGVATVLVTFVVGVFWELLELVARYVGKRYDVEPVLVHYGWRDTAYDLLFDLVGAVIVVALDLRTFVAFAGRFPSATVTALSVTTGVVTVGSVLLGVGMVVSGEWNE